MRNFIVLCSFLILCSCTSRITDFTIISTKNYNINSSHRIKGERVTGTDEKHIIVVIPTGEPNVKEAIDNAIESVPGCVGLADGAVYHTAWYIPYIYGKMSYTIEGTAILEKFPSK